MVTRQECFPARKLERTIYDSVAFRFIAANEHPDHDTIAVFRRHFIKQIEPLFVQVLSVAREMGVLRMGAVALDGTKVHANAGRHSELSYQNAGKIEAQLQAEVAELMAKAETANQTDLLNGMVIPEELAWREKRLAEIVRAKATIAARVKERYAHISKMACSPLRHIHIASKAELKQRIMAQLDDLNCDPVVHTWSYKLKSAA